MGLVKKISNWLDLLLFRVVSLFRKKEYDFQFVKTYVYPSIPGKPIPCWYLSLKLPKADKYTYVQVNGNKQVFLGDRKSYFFSKKEALECARDVIRQVLNKELDRNKNQ